MSEAVTASQATTRMASAASAQGNAQGAAGDDLDPRRTVSKDDVAPNDDPIGRKVEDYAGDDEMGYVDRRQSREWGESSPRYCLGSGHGFVYRLFK
jgi:hypothetical protein